MPATCRRTRRARSNRRTHGGVAGLNEAFADAKAVASPPAPAAAQKGGRRKSRKLSKGAKAWTTAVTKLYREMKSKDKSAKFSDALKRASVLKKKGQL